MFATLVGANTESVKHESIFEQLCEIANTRGFRPGDATLHIQPDQMPLAGWSLLLRGPSDGKADFLLAVTAPKVPSVSPIPVRKTVSGPLFSVVVMDTFFGVWQQGDFSEFKESESVLKAFDKFLSSLSVSS
jgi:hypothetical protein